jgi:hypothetical protein
MAKQDEWGFFDLDEDLKKNRSSLANTALEQVADLIMADDLLCPDWRTRQPGNAEHREDLRDAVIGACEARGLDDVQIGIILDFTGTNV